MVICPKCNLEYSGEKNFCKRCGSFLLSTEGTSVRLEESTSTTPEKARSKLICSKCQTPHSVGNYCRRCGSLLTEHLVAEESDTLAFEASPVKKRSKEWLKLNEEKERLQHCLSKLEGQRAQVSPDVLDPMITRYQDELQSLTAAAQEIEVELTSVKQRASQEIDRLEKDLEPIRRRFADLHSLYRSGGMKRGDFNREKKEILRSIRSKEKSLEKYRQILFTLPNSLGGKLGSHRQARSLLEPVPIIAFCGAIALTVGAAFVTWRSFSPSTTTAYEENVLPASRSTLPTAHETDGIKSLFETIRQANLKKDIDLFMSCYAHDFKERKEKRQATLETWKNYDYLDLSYQMTKLLLTGDRATVSVEWQIRTSLRAGGPPQQARALLDVVLTKEDGKWKIKEIQSSR